MAKPVPSDVDLNPALKPMPSPHDLDPTPNRVSDWARFGAMLAALPLKRAYFVKGYIVHGNATKAAGDAGYALATAYSEGSRLLKVVDVRDAIALAIELRDRERRLDKTFVVDKLMEMVDLCSREVPITNREGVIVGYDISNPAGANKALELLGKTLGIFTDVQEHRGPHGGAIEVIARPISDSKLMDVARILKDINALPALDAPVEAPNSPSESPTTPVIEKGAVREVPGEPEGWDWDVETAKDAE